MGDEKEASRALEHALDLAEPDGLLFPFALVPVNEILERHRSSGTAHVALVTEAAVLSLGGQPLQRRPDHSDFVDEPPSEAELRVLRYLPTNMQAQEIAGELFVSVNTVRTHMRHLYAKLGVHSRSEAVDKGRILGLLSPSLPRR